MVVGNLPWVLKNYNENIAIRRHPIERYLDYRSNDDYLKTINELFGTN